MVVQALASRKAKFRATGGGGGGGETGESDCLPNKALRCLLEGVEGRCGLVSVLGRRHQAKRGQLTF